MRILLSALVLAIITAAPLFAVYLRVKNGKNGKSALIANFCFFFGFVAIASVYCFGQSAHAAESAGGLITADGFSQGMKYIAAALSVSISGIGGGIAVAASASAALGALSENENIFGKALIFVGMAEGVALYGLLIAFMLIMS